MHRIRLSKSLTSLSTYANWKQQMRIQGITSQDPASASNVLRQMTFSSGTPMIAQHLPRSRLGPLRKWHWQTLRTWGESANSTCKRIKPMIAWTMKCSQGWSSLGLLFTRLSPYSLKKTKLSKSTSTASRIVSHTPLSCIYILGKTCLLEIRRELLILSW